ncbi:MAG: tRNA (N6-isopentenyl adenosine(37)-C2)-methylthiotransferase MiaB [Pseudomonadota bacterium]|nr:tRNA (N6-isopentenyl adenosine(37)-C2)-methylthiotransferase MiaB [Pseudomonadota bacterium]
MATEQQAQSITRNTDKSLCIKTFGCQMNVYDSERMSELLGQVGFSKRSAMDTADMVILNTCHIREKASEKLFSELGRLRLIKEARGRLGDRMIVAVAGCVAQGIGKEITRRFPEVDIVVGPQSYHELPSLVARTLGSGETRLVQTEFPVESKFDSLPDTRSHEGTTAFLSIQEGCDKFCTFCVVPYTRGVEYSRPVSEVIFEARSLVECGVQDITLLGQNVNAYHGLDGNNRNASLSILIEELGKIEGLLRVKYTTSHPRDMDINLISAHERLSFLMPYLHLPVQSGSNSVLKAMNRGYTAEEYLDIVDQLRNARPDIALSSDFIVGFPGETQEDFEATLSLVEKVNFAQAYSFKYSPRPGTPAADAKGSVDYEVAGRRLACLQQALDRQQLNFNLSKVGSKLQILIEKPGRNYGQMIGKSQYMQAVHVETGGRSRPLKVGDFIEVDVVAASKNSLTGNRA